MNPLFLGKLLHGAGAKAVLPISGARVDAVGIKRRAVRSRERHQAVEPRTDSLEPDIKVDFDVAPEAADKVTSPAGTRRRVSRRAKKPPVRPAKRPTAASRSPVMGVLVAPVVAALLFWNYGHSKTSSLRPVAHVQMAPMHTGHR
jgi:hypothetical protein